MQTLKKTDIILEFIKNNGSIKAKNYQKFGEKMNCHASEARYIIKEIINANLNGFPANKYFNFYYQLGYNDNDNIIYWKGSQEYKNLIFIK